jgi:hypothetical protein
MKELVRCMKCKTQKKVEVSVKEIQTKKGVKYQVKGNCPDCNTNVSKFISKQRATEFDGKGDDTPTPITPPTPPKPKPIENVTIINGKKVIDYDKKMGLVQKRYLEEEKKRWFIHKWFDK